MRPDHTVVTAESVHYRGVPSCCRAGSFMGCQLARLDPQREPVRGRRERARPGVVPGARRVEREVEVEDERVRRAAEIGAFHRVEQVAARAVGLAAARRVAEREEDAAAVRVEPVELERVLAEARPGEAREARDAARAAGDLERAPARRARPRPRNGGRLVREVRRLAAVARRLRMRAIELRRAPRTSAASRRSGSSAARTSA